MAPIADVGRDRDRLRAGLDAVEALVGEVRARRRRLAVDAVGAAAVLVHRRADVEARRNDVDAGWPPGSRLTSTTRPLLERRGSRATTRSPSSSHGALRPTLGLRDHLRRDGRRPGPVRRGCLRLEPGGPTAAAMVLRHAADPAAGVGDAHAVHEERGAPAARARGRGLGRLLRAAVRRGRGVLARDRAPARLRLRDPPHARPASAGRRARSCARRAIRRS